MAEANLLDPRPDFIFYGGDIAQLGKPEEIDHGLQILGGLRGKVHYVMGEHHYYVDLGGYRLDQLSPDHYSFDHKGIHFVVLNSILTYDEWMHGDWEKPMDRMLQMARLDNPKGSPFMVGESQRRWLEKDLKGVRRDTPATRMPAIRTRRPIPNSSSSLDVWRSSGRWSTGASGFSFVIKARHQVHRRTMERLSPRRGRTKRQAGWYVA